MINSRTAPAENSKRYAVLGAFAAIIASANEYYDYAHRTLTNEGHKLLTACVKYLVPSHYRGDAAMTSTSQVFSAMSLTKHSPPVALSNRITAIPKNHPVVLSFLSSLEKEYSNTTVATVLNQGACHYLSIEGNPPPFHSPR